MRLFDRLSSGNLDRREMQLAILACSAIVVLAGGLALFMYPVVFSQAPTAPTRTIAITFYGFCGTVHSSSGVHLKSSGDDWAPSRTNRGRAHAGLRGPKKIQRRTFERAAKLWIVSGSVVDGIPAGCRGEKKYVGFRHHDRST